MYIDRTKQLLVLSLVLIMLCSRVNAFESQQQNALVFEEAEKILKNIHMPRIALGNLLSKLESIEGKQSYLAKAFLAVASTQNKYEMDKKVAHQHIFCAAMKQHGFFISYLGYCFQHGIGCSINLKEARNLYAEAVQYGDPVGQYYYGCFLIDRGCLCDQDYEQVFELFLGAMKKGVKIPIHFLEDFLDVRFKKNTFNPVDIDKGIEALRSPECQPVGYEKACQLMGEVLKCGDCFIPYTGAYPILKLMTFREGLNQLSPETHTFFEIAGQLYMTKGGANIGNCNDLLLDLYSDKQGGQDQWRTAQEKFEDLLFISRYMMRNIAGVAKN
ncbi:MAG: hypothetical protein ACPGXY_01405 [Alphaproteobacteria bacterium]